MDNLEIDRTSVRELPRGYGGTPKHTQYHEYVCSQCGKDAKNTYCEPSRTNMLKRLLCFTCNYWEDFAETTNPTSATIIGGRVYTSGNRTEGAMLGMAGRRFDIEYIGSSDYAGQKITTNDLWSGSDVPAHLLIRFPDTAKFLGGAEQCEVGGTTCWNDSDRRSPEYPRPHTLKKRK